VRGSLDVLLSTPMPTRSILAGKWWGSFRRAFGIALWPAATTALLAYDSGYWIGCLLLVGLVLAHGAAITSLGLGVATWVASVGRAIALCVTIYLLSIAGWPIVLRASFWDEPNFREALLTGEPPVGVMYATMATSTAGVGLVTHGAIRGEVFLWVFGWIVVLAIVAAALFGATSATFDDRLGRIPDDGPRPARRTERSSLSEAELLALVASSTEDEEP
jgi:hypothetical protein